MQQCDASTVSPSHPGRRLRLARARVSASPLSTVPTARALRYLGRGLEPCATGHGRERRPPLPLARLAFALALRNTRSGARITNMPRMSACVHAAFFQIHIEPFRRARSHRNAPPREQECAPHPCHATLCGQMGKGGAVLAYHGPALRSRASHWPLPPTRGDGDAARWRLKP